MLTLLGSIIGTDGVMAGSVAASMTVPATVERATCTMLTLTIGPFESVSEVGILGAEGSIPSPHIISA